MLFNQGYDNSLWLILSGDKKNRDLILEFIKSIPKKVYEEIQMYLINENTQKNLFGIKKSKQKYTYAYSVDRKTKKIYIARYILNKGNYGEIFMLSLFLYRGLEDKVLIGTISYSITNKEYNNITDCDKIDYSLIKTPFGVLLKKHCEYSTIPNTFSRFDSLEEIDCCKFNDNDNLNKLIRKKQRKLRLR